MGDFDPSWYEHGQKLGAGTCGYVHKATMKNISLQSGSKSYPVHVAVKIIPINESNKYCDRESELLESDKFNFEHQNIIKYFKWLIVNEGSIPCHHIYMEYCDTDLKKVLQNRKEKLSAGELVHVTRSLGEGVHHLHSQKLIHRDIKPSNILLKTDKVEDGSDLTRFEVKIADFNISRPTQGAEQTMTWQVGSTSFMAPEVFKQHRDSNSAKYGFPADIFSVGAVLFQAATLQNLITNSPDVVEDKLSVQDKIAALPSGNMKLLLSGCLKDEPSQRLDIEGVLRHPFLKSYPDTFTVSGNGGPAGKKHPRCLGVFKKIEARRGGVPVWKNGHGMFFYYDDVYGCWNIYDDYTSHGHGPIYHWSSSEKNPTRGFSYCDGNTWQVDPNLTVVY